MIIISLLGFIVVLGIIVMDRGHDFDYALVLIARRLTPYGIRVNITFQHDGIIVIEAFKEMGNVFKHYRIESESILEAIWNLIKYVEKELEDWIEHEPYTEGSKLLGSN